MRLDACESDGERTAYPQRAHGDFEQVLGMIDQPVERQGLTQRAQRVGQNRYMGFVFERSQAFLLVGWLVGWLAPTKGQFGHHIDSSKGQRAKGAE